LHFQRVVLRLTGCMCTWLSDWSGLDLVVRLHRSPGTASAPCSAHSSLRILCRLRLRSCIFRSGKSDRRGRVPCRACMSRCWLYYSNTPLEKWYPHTGRSMCLLRRYRCRMWPGCILGRFQYIARGLETDLDWDQGTDWDLDWDQGTDWDLDWEMEWDQESWWL